MAKSKLCISLLIAASLLVTSFTGCANKGAVTALATTSANERYPVWSPDGSKISFKSDNWIYVCDLDGSQREKLTEIKESFVFSPDMKRVFYKKTISNEGKVIYQVYVMDIDGKNQKKIAELELEETYVDDGGYIGSTRGPMYKMYSWSPDRTKIFFAKLEETGYTWVWREEEGKWTRYEVGTEPSVIPVVPWAGTEQKLIAKEHERTAWIWDLKDNELRFIGHLTYSIVSYFFEQGVVWSPDGKYVALPSTELSEAGATEQVFVVNIETGESQRLTSFVGYNAYPEWSPDSKKIMYLRVPPEYWWMPSSLDYDEGYDVWVVDIDGSNEKQLTDIPKNWEAGGWSPDGSKIVYTSCKKSSMGVGETQEIGIWIMNADGSDKKLLTKVATGFIEHMEWSPDGSKIAFVTYELRKDRDDRDIYVIDVPAN